VQRPARRRLRSGLRRRGGGLGGSRRLRGRLGLGGGLLRSLVELLLRLALRLLLLLAKQVFLLAGEELLALARLGVAQRLLLGGDDRRRRAGRRRGGRRRRRHDLDDGRGDFLGHDGRGRFLLATDEHALLAHLDLDRARLAA
jgi:hypothetical protein